MTIETGLEIGNYKIVSNIGSGGMGEVFLAEDTRLNRRIAIKFLNEDVGSDVEKLSRFIQEAKTASALNHPNILTVFEIGDFNGTPYIATEFIDGETLRERLAKDPLDLDSAMGLTLQITAALAASHDAGVIHRDLKPENIMIRNDGLVKVLDFGLAKLAPVSAESVQTTVPQLITRSGTIVGTVAYMSPEQAKGKKLDMRSDIFSLGILLFEMFAGQRPFAGESHLELVSSILKDDPPTLLAIAPDLPRQLGRIVDKTLRKDRNHRYQHVRDLHIDIEDLREEIKFEAKLTNSTRSTVIGGPQVTNPSSIGSQLRSAFTTNITETRRFTLLHALIFFAVAGAIAGAIWFFRPTAGVQPTQFKTTEVAIWSSAPGELSSSASFSPDGKLIAFASTKSGTKGIWVTQATSTDAIAVTNDSYANTNPIWSPKGDEIAYMSLRPNQTGGNSAELWRVSALGGVPKSIATLPSGSAELLYWGQSGGIYYELNRKDLFVVDFSNGTSQKVISVEGAQIKWLHISSDEKSIVYAVQTDDKWQILTAELDGKSPAALADGAGEMAFGSASASGVKRLFFSVAIDGAEQINLLTTDSGRVAPIANPETGSRIVAADPDGRSILLSSAREESNIWRVGVADATEAPVARDLSSELWPAVSPDNERIAYQSIKNLSAGDNLFDGNIVVKPFNSRDNDRPVSLTEHGYLPAFSPDGSTVAYLRKTGKNADLFLVNPNGGGERRLTNGGVVTVGNSLLPYNTNQTNAFAWSPDGSRIAFISNRNEAYNVWIVNLRDGSEAQVSTMAEGDLLYYCPVFSPDGRRIAFAYQKKTRDENGRFARGVAMVDTPSNKTVKVWEAARPFRLIGWSADGNSLIAAEPSKEYAGLPSETSLSRISMDGTETSIAKLKNIYFYNIFLSEDKKQIAFAARDRDMDDIWVIPSAGGVSRRITNNNDSGLYFSRLAWLHDGTGIVFGKQTRFSLLSRMIDIN